MLSSMWKKSLTIEIFRKKNRHITRVFWGKTDDYKESSEKKQRLNFENFMKKTVDYRNFSTKTVKFPTVFSGKTNSYREFSEKNRKISVIWRETPLNYEGFLREKQMTIANTQKRIIKFRKFKQKDGWISKKKTMKCDSFLGKNKCLWVLWIKIQCGSYLPHPTSYATGDLRSIIRCKDKKKRLYNVSPLFFDMNSL